MTDTRVVGEVLAPSALQGEVPNDDRTRARRWLPGAICCVLYAAITMSVFGHFDSLGPGHATGSLSTDDIDQIWWLAWTSFALTHGHDVFLAQWQNYPAGQNFGIQGPILGIATLFTPVTKLFGPIVSWNIAVRFVVAASASSMCFVLRRWVTWWPAAFFGGLLYGFSAYMMFWAGGLFILTFVPLPPIFFLLLHEVLVRQKWRAWKAGALLGIVCWLQFWFGLEVLTSMVIMGTIATALCLIARHRHLSEMWRFATRAVLFGAGIAGVLLLIPAAFVVFGPQSVHGAPGATAAQGYVADLFGTFVPGSEWLGSNALTSLAHTRFLYSAPAYLGIPLIVVLVSFAVFLRSRKSMLFAGAMAVIALVLSMGPRLRVDGHDTPIVLPYALFGHFPLLNSLSAIRFSLYTCLFSAAMFAIGLDELRLRLTSARAPGVVPLRWAHLATAGLLLVGAVVFLPLVPNHTVRATSTKVPSFFDSNVVDAIPQGSVLLSYPYPDSTGGLFFSASKEIMLYQAVSGMRFKLIGGYGWFPSANGSAGTAPSVLTPRSVESSFDRAYFVPPSQSSPGDQSRAVSDLQRFLRRNHVDTVVLQPKGDDPATVFTTVTATLGCPAYQPTFAIWLHVQQRLRSGSPGRPVSSCQGPQEPVPNQITPRDNSKVSGPTPLLAQTFDYLNVADVAFSITATSSGSALTVAAASTPFGWLAAWNSATVSNGLYTVRTVATDTDGAKSVSTPVKVTVKN